MRRSGICLKWFRGRHFAPLVPYREEGWYLKAEKGQLSPKAIARAEILRDDLFGTYIPYLFIHGKIFSIYYNKTFDFHYNYTLLQDCRVGRSPTDTYYIVGQFPF